MFDFIKREPVVVLGLVEAGVVALVAFGVNISVEQKVAIASLTAALLTIVTRQLVTPMAKVSK